jgi:hypothetical protein
MKKSNIIVAIIAILVAIGAVTLGTYTNDRMMEKVATKMAKEEMKDGLKGESMDDKYILTFLSGTTYQPAQTSTLEFTVVDKDGKRLNQEDYKIEHEKRMHVIVASQDLTQFQHVHPVFDTSTSSYKLPDFVFPVAGQYRIFTDFVVNSHDEADGKAGGDMNMSKHAGVQYQDVIVGDITGEQPQPLGQPNTTATAGGLTVNMTTKPGESAHEKRLSFEIAADGQKVTNLQKYLGALGHLVVLREGDLEYIHTHALTTDVAKQTGTVEFDVDFKQPGNYKAFAQFQRAGKVVTTSFVIAVK